MAFAILACLVVFAQTASAQIVFRNPNDPSIDTSVPVVAFVLPTAGATYDAGTASTLSNASGTATAPNGIAICRWTNNQGGSGTANTASNGAWVIPGILLTVGSNVVTVSCQSATNVTGSTVLTVSRSSAPASCGSAGCLYVDSDCGTPGNGSLDVCDGSGNGQMSNLQTAFDAAVAGKTIVVHGGVDYVTANGTGSTNPSGFTFSASGTAGNPITLRNAPGERPVLRGCPASSTTIAECNRATISVYNREYVTITSDSCPTSGTTTLGFHVYGLIVLYDDAGPTEASMAHGSEVSCVEGERGYSNADDGNWSTLWTQGQYGFTARSNYFHDVTYLTLSGSGTQSSTACFKMFLTSFSTIRNNRCLRVVPTQAGGIDCKADCVSNQLYENDIRDISICLRVENQETAGGPYTTNGATGSVFRNNLCVSASASVRGAVRFEDGKITDIAIYNNTFVDFVYVLEELHQSANVCQGISLYNNALYGTVDLHLLQPSDSGMGVECSLALSNYNFFGTLASQPRYRYMGTNYSALANWTATGFDLNSTATAEANFLFTDAAAGVFTLQALSPLQGAGRVGGSGATAIDVGAYTDTITCIGDQC